MPLSSQDRAVFTELKKDITKTLKTTITTKNTYKQKTMAPIKTMATVAIDVPSTVDTENSQTKYLPFNPKIGRFSVWL